MSRSRLANVGSPLQCSSPTVLMSHQCSSPLSVCSPFWWFKVEFWCFKKKSWFQQWVEDDWKNIGFEYITGFYHWPTSPSLQPLSRHLLDTFALCNYPFRTPPSKHCSNIKLRSWRCPNVIHFASKHLQDTVKTSSHTPKCIHFQIRNTFNFNLKYLR